MPLSYFKGELGCNNVACLGSLIALFEIERDGLTNLKVVEFSIARAVVEKHVRGSFRRNKAESFLGLGLDSACRHKKMKKK